MSDPVAAPAPVVVDASADAPDLSGHAAATPAWKDKRMWMAIGTGSVITLNHKLGLNVSVEELMVLVGVVGGYIGQSQFGQLARLKTLVSAGA